MRRIISLLLSFMLVFGQCPSVAFADTVNTCAIGVTEYATLDEALAAATSGQTITLLDNITCTSPLVIDAKTVYFELGAYNLLVDISGNPDPSITFAVRVINGGKIRLTGTETGEFNVKSSLSRIGVIVNGISEITVNNIVAEGEGATAVFMYGSGDYLDGGKMTVHGNIISGNTGIDVNAKNANITVNGDITAGNCAISIATNPNTFVTVNGSITVLGNQSIDYEGAAVRSNGGSTVSITGNVSNYGINNIGVHAYGGTITVGGNVLSSGIGAKADKNYNYGNGSVTISGTLSSGTPFIVTGTTNKTSAEITSPTSKDGYLTYTDDVSTVWIANAGEPVYSAPSMPQNFAAAAGDSEAALSWTAPLNDGGRPISKYQVSKDNGANWADAGLVTSYTASGLTNGTSYDFKVRAVNQEGNGLEAYTSATPREDACSIGATTYGTLGEALNTIDWGETATITLLKNIDYDQGITLSNIMVTFNLNGYTLNVANADEYGSALDVNSGGSVALSGNGALNVTGPVGGYGVTVQSSSSATVTNAYANGPDSVAAHAYGNSSLVVLQDVVATGVRSIGVHAQSSSVIEARGNVSGGNQGVCVSGATAIVIGNVEANGLDMIDQPEGIGVNAYDGIIEVGGNVTSNRVGAMIRNGGSIQIEGTLTSPDYIQFNDDPAVTINDDVTPTTKAGYRTYQLDENTVWVKAEAAPAGSPAPSNRRPAYTADIRGEDGTGKVLAIAIRNDVATVFVEEDLWSAGSQSKTVLSMPSLNGIDAFSAGISVADLSTSDASGMLTLKTDAGSVTVPSNMLTGTVDALGTRAQISIARVDKEKLPEHVRDAIGDRPVIQLSLAIDGRQTEWSNPNAPVSVSVPYKPSADELKNPLSIVIRYIDGSGNIVFVPNGHYDPASGTVTFTTTHFSYYAVSYHHLSFQDVAEDAWYFEPVSYLAAREITIGSGEQTFSPDSKVTRGQFITMLMKAFGISPDLDSADNFADAGNTYYTGYLAAAKRLQIAAGSGNNLFGPAKEITRQEMFTLLYNALWAVDKMPQSGSEKPLAHFSDAGQLAPWATEAVGQLVNQGLVQGSHGMLKPIDTSTRGETAQLLYNFLAE